MGKKLFKSGFIKVEPNQEIDLLPIVLEEEKRGIIHGTVKNVCGKVCVESSLRSRKQTKKTYY